MHNDLVGDLGLSALANLTPESPEWDQLPSDKAVPDKATRQAMIEAAKLILSPEQTANRDALRALGANADSYNKEDWQGWLKAQPAALYDLNHWMGRLSQGAAEILKPIHVDRDQLSTAANIVMGIFTLGIGNAIHTGTHKPGYSAEQQFVVDQLRAQGRDPTVLETAMEEAHDEWVDAVIESSFMAAVSVALVAVPVVGGLGSTVGSAAATVVGQAGRAVGNAIERTLVRGLGEVMTRFGNSVSQATRSAYEALLNGVRRGATAEELRPLMTAFSKSVKAEPAGAAQQQLATVEANLDRMQAASRTPPFGPSSSGLVQRNPGSPAGS